MAKKNENALPDGWEWKEFKEIVDNHDNVRIPLKSSDRELKQGSYPYYGASGIIDNINDYLFDGEYLLISEDGANLVARKYPIAFIATGKFWVNNHAHIVDAKKQITSNTFLEYFFKSTDISFLITGSAQPKLSQRKLNTLQIPLPPLAEQQRLVKKLDAAFERIDKAITLVQTNLEKIPQLKKALLDQAFKGQLFGTVKVGKNGLPLGWSVSSLSTVVDFVGGSQPPKSKFSLEKKKGYVRLIQIRDYKSDRHIVYINKNSTKKFCTVDDIMIGRYGPPVFQILKGLEGAYNVALMKAIPDESLISKDFLFLYLKSPAIQNYIISISQRAAGQSGVNKKALEKYDMYYPSLAEQQKIVKKLNDLFQQLEQLAAENQAKLEHLDQLKKSLLDQAFRGNL